MSKLEELIQKYCPDGVECKPLGECCTILDGKRKPITKGARQSGPYPYYGANGIQDWVADYIFDGTYVLIGEDGSVITPNGTPVVNWAQGRIWVNNHAHIIAEKTGVLLRFLFYYIQIIDIHNLVHGNIPKLTQGDLKGLEIPVPPLPVQEEIVRVLDVFTELQAELQAELHNRIQQYNYYRDSLLSFEGRSDVEWMMLGDITKTFKGAYITQKGSTAGSIPVVLGGQVPAYFIDTANHKGELVAVSRSGASAGFVSYWNEPIYITDGFGFEVNENVLTYKYLYYALKKIEPSLQQMKRGGGVPHVSYKELFLVVIPVPSLAEQKEIVDVLDRFDTLTNDLAAGLPAEIENRRLQYEYYRDKLLTFKRKEA